MGEEEWPEKRHIKYGIDYQLFFGSKDLSDRALPHKCSLFTHTPPSDLLQISPPCREGDMRLQRNRDREKRACWSFRGTEVKHEWRKTKQVHLCGK